MWLKYILNNILIYYLPIAITLTLGIIAIKIIKKKLFIIIVSNTILLLTIIIITLCLIPPTKPLQVEIALYSLTKLPDDVYTLKNLVSENSKEFLSISNKLGDIKTLPEVNSGDEIQIRLKLNRKASLYLFHFDTTSISLRQLFPSSDIKFNNPLPADSWIELPANRKSWTVDQNPGIEIFLIFVSSKDSPQAFNRINKLLASVKSNYKDRFLMLKQFDLELLSIGSYYQVSNGELAHNLSCTSPTKVTTLILCGKYMDDLLFWQYIQHK